MGRILFGPGWKKAEEDFRSAQILEAAEPPALSAACFHCQQAAEKYLKAVLVKENVEPPRTHDLSALLDLTPLSEESVYDAAEFLNPFAVSIRYPSSDPTPTPEETREALDQVRLIVEACTERISAD